MMSSPYPQQQLPQFREEPKSGCGCGLPILLGCLGVVVVCLIACGGGIWYVANNADKWAVGWGREAVVAMIGEAQIPDQEKTEVIAQVDRVVGAYQARQITLQDLQRIMEELQQSPIFNMIAMWGIEKTHLDPSGLSDEEKQQGRRTIERALRGVYEKKITQDQLDGVLPAAAGTDSATEVKVQNGKPVVISKTTPPATRLTDEEVRQLLTDLKQLADDAEIPDEPLQIDIGDEVKKAVDAALQGKGGP